MSELPHPRVLFCAFAEVPGPTARGTRLAQWLSVFGNKNTDALSLKGVKDAHIQRLGGARVMRVPNALGKPFSEQLSTYARALTRQLAADQYDLIWCADLASAAIVAATKTGNTPLVVEATGSSVDRLQGEQQKRHRELERVVLKNAARIVVPSGYALRHLGQRAEARKVAVVPRCVDRTVFAPPSIEVALDDEQRILVFGGREGGKRLEMAVAALARICARAAPTVRVALLGTPSDLDAGVTAALSTAGLVPRVELMDADSPLAVSAALSLAHVVVTIASDGSELEAPSVPHRALEAMACGRAVVIAGAEPAFADAVNAGDDCVVVALDPDRIAEAALSLLAQPGRRETIARAAARHAEATADLVLRSAAVQQVIFEGTKVRLDLHPPRDDEHDTSSRSHPEPRAFARAKPPVRPRPEPSPIPDLPLSSPALASPALAPPALAAPPAEPSGPNTGLARGIEPMETVRMDAPAFSHLESPPGMWEGDTVLDSASASGPQIVQTNPDAERVKAAMLVSSDANRSNPESSLTSVRVRSELDSLEPESQSPDPWVNDTIADGSPVDTMRPPDKAPAAKPPSTKSLLVDMEGRPRTDVTAEDPKEGGTSDT